MAAMMAWSDSDAQQPPPKFSADQCRVLKQVGVDISDICPKPKPPKKKRVKQ
jgi:hypothetical protein